MGPTDPELVAAVSQAQAAGARIVAEVSNRLEPGMTGDDIIKLAARLADAQQTPLLSRARVGIGPLGASSPAFVAARARLNEATLVTIDVRPRVGTVAGDYARSVHFGDSGRIWFYQRIARRVYDAFLSQLDGCRVERDAYDVALACAHREGCRLIGRPGTIGHHLPLHLPAGMLGRVASTREHLEHALRALVPFGLATPPLLGIWSIEPCIEVDQHQFAYEDAFLFTERGATRLGDEAPPQPDRAER